MDNSVIKSQCRHNEHEGISNHQPYDCMLSHLFRGRSKKTSKICITVLCAGNSPVTSEFPTQRASNAEIVSIWWCHHIVILYKSSHQWTRQIWGIWKLRPAYSPETPNLGQNWWCFVPCDLEIWWMTLQNNRASLLCCFKLCATFHSHWWIQTGVTVRKRPIWVKFDDF